MVEISRRGKTEEGGQEEQREEGKCEPPRLTVPLSDPTASPKPLLDSQLTRIQPKGCRPGTTT
jgi:hypothetical protein